MHRWTLAFDRWCIFQCWVSSLDRSARLFEKTTRTGECNLAAWWWSAANRSEKYMTWPICHRTKSCTWTWPINRVSWWTVAHLHETGKLALSRPDCSKATKQNVKSKYGCRVAVLNWPRGWIIKAWSIDKLHPLFTLMSSVLKKITQINSSFIWVVWMLCCILNVLTNCEKNKKIFTLQVFKTSKYE